MPPVYTSTHSYLHARGFFYTPREIYSLKAERNLKFRNVLNYAKLEWSYLMGYTLSI